MKNRGLQMERGKTTDLFEFPRGRSQAQLVVVRLESDAAVLVEVVEVVVVNSSSSHVDILMLFDAAHNGLHLGLGIGHGDDVG